MCQIKRNDRWKEKNDTNSQTAVVAIVLEDEDGNRVPLQFAIQFYTDATNSG